MRLKINLAPPTKKNKKKSFYVYLNSHEELGNLGIKHFLRLQAPYLIFGI